MADLNWGALQKSSVDAETIEEAIARLILAHEADETAHLGIGESLQAHKASEVIDHLAGSIVADKINPLELLIDQAWPDVASLTSGANCRTTFPRLNLAADWETPATVWGNFYVMFPDMASIYAHEVIFRVPVGFETYGTGNFAQMGMWSSGSWTTNIVRCDGIYFSIEGGTLYGVVKSGTFLEAVNFGVVDEVVLNTVWEIFYSPVDKIVRFKIDGVEVGTVNISSEPSFPWGVYCGGRTYAPDEENQITLTAYKVFFSLRTL